MKKTNTKKKIAVNPLKKRGKVKSEGIEAAPDFEKKNCKKLTDKQKSKEALKHFENLRKMIAKNPSPIFKMNEEDVIKEMRKTREELWNKKYASNS